MYSTSLGVKWIVEATATAPVPLRVTVVAPSARDVSNLVANSGGFLDVCRDRLGASGFIWEQARARLKLVSGSQIDFYRSSDPNALRGTRCDMAWIVGAGGMHHQEFQQVRKECIHTLHPHEALSITPATFDDLLLVTH